MSPIENNRKDDLIIIVEDSKQEINNSVIDKNEIKPIIVNRSVQQQVQQTELIPKSILKTSSKLSKSFDQPNQKQPILKRHSFDVCFPSTTKITHSILKHSHSSNDEDITEDDRQPIKPILKKNKSLEHFQDPNKNQSKSDWPTTSSSQQTTNFKESTNQQLVKQPFIQKQLIFKQIPDKTKQYFFMKSSSVDHPSQEDGSSVPYFLPRRSNTQVNEMKNLFESKLNESKFKNEYLYNVPNRKDLNLTDNYDLNRKLSSRNQSFSTKKSSTLPNLMSYKLNEPIDKKQKKPSKLRKLKSAHHLLNRSLQLSKSNSKSNYNRDSDEFEASQKFTDESEHETSSSSSSYSRQEF